MVRFCLSALTLFVAIAAAAPAAGQSSQTVLLDFSIPGCMPCRQMEPDIMRLKSEGFPVRKVDASRERPLAERFGVSRFPTLILLHEGRVAHRSEGPMSYGQLRQLLSSVGAAPATTRPMAQRSGGAPATFASAAPQPGRSFQVGDDLGPAPEVTIPGAAAPPTRSAGGPPAATLLSSSVRLKVRDGGGSSFGTGTIIDARRGEALVLTCGHLFRDAAPGKSAAPQIVVELFDPSAAGVHVREQVAGNLITMDLERDVALVSIRPRTPPTVAPVAASVTAAPNGGAVWSVGCDRGADPTVRTGRVTSVDRYTKPPALTATGAPVVGRSGGGLFNDRGEVVGVCFGADEAENQGFYAKLSSIHSVLDRVGLSAIYRGGQPGMTLAAAEPAALPPAPGSPSGMVPVRPAPVIRGQDSFATPPPSAFGSMSDRERAALEELSRRAAESEVVCIIRPKTADGQSEIIKLDSVSPAFLQALRAIPERR